MVPGIRIRKLSLQVKEKLDSLKRRKRSNSANVEQNAQDIEIVHPHFDETVPIRQSAPGEFRRNPRYDYKSWDDQGWSVNSDPQDSLETHLPSNSFPAIFEERSFSMDEWQKKVDTAVFGSSRSRSNKTRRSAVESAAKEQSSDPDMQLGGQQPTHCMDDRQTASLHTEHAPLSQPMFQQQQQPPPLVSFPRLSSTDYNMSLSPAVPSAIHRSCSGSSTISGMSTVSCGVSALNEILFATNSHIETELRSMVKQCIGDEDKVHGFVSRFERVIDRAYRDFVAAALSVIDVDNGKLTGKSVSQIIDEYGSAKRGFGRPDSGFIGGDAEDTDEHRRLVFELRQRDISQVKYSKEQMHLYAATGLTKYVSSQVLLSTGIENDLVDKLGEAVEDLDKTSGQLDILNSLESQYVKSESTDISMLRNKAAEIQSTIERLKLETQEAAHIRHTFETVLLEIQGL
ncbi:hypothetical protein LPJ56_001133 [Coemansia sp. RSA 2599]|nr:hypothetical protein LPJ56_001133 [Coemansia sp. RSA 2599]